MTISLYNIAAGKTRAVMAHISNLRNPYLDSGTDEGWKLEKAWEAKREHALSQVTANKMLELMGL